MEFEFCGIRFIEQEGKISALLSEGCVPFPLSDVRVAGGYIDEQSPAKMTGSGESRALRFVGKTQTDKKLEIVRESGRLRAVTLFEKRGGGVRARTEIRNISSDKIVLDNVSAVTLSGIDGGAEKTNVFLYRFHNSHHMECQPRRLSFDDLGLFSADHRSYKRIFGCNAGSWTCKEELPQAIVENGETGRFFMFQIESCGGWYWEIADAGESCYLTLSGGNREHTQWRKKLIPGGKYVTPWVAFAQGDSLNDVVGKMTSYRRATARFTRADDKKLAVFNEYMHLSWDSPDEARTEKLIPVAAAAGADVYVIDCGWHDEEDGYMIYPYVGKWKESKKRFPHGVRRITDMIRAHGMRAGLWIEPEIVGSLSGVEYPPDGYIREGGERAIAAGRYFLDYRSRAVRTAMSDAIRRMVEEYGADYIKIDCNQDSGAGTEYRSDSAGDGLEKTTGAFWKWLASERRKYPHVLFESCASGGQRMDWKSLSLSPMISTSDQVFYQKYPYIVGNIFSAVLPEQAGFWSYPYCSLKGLGIDTPDEKNPVPHSVVMNMVNASLGRLHLASDLSALSAPLFELVKEGVAYGKSIAAFRKKASPFFPTGFTSFGREVVSVGLIKGKRLVLAVWNLGLAKEAEIPLGGLRAKEIRVGYPAQLPVAFTCTDSGIRFSLEDMQSFVLDIRLK